MTKQQHKILSGPYRAVMAIFLVIFGVYNFIIYTSSSKKPVELMSKEAISGQGLWQENNCTACHQLYGLGGYLGPDLTNVISTPGKGPDYVKAFLNSGIKVMPKFSFSEEEKSAVVAFLSHVDGTGYFPNVEGEIQKTGWVKLKYKTPKNGKSE